MFTKTDIENYFEAEKMLTTIFMVLGAIAIVLALIFFFVVKSSFYKGAAIPFFMLGIIQLAASFTVYNKADIQRKQLVYAYDMNPPLLKQKELPRMRKVNNSFNILFIGEIACIILGLGLFFYYKNNTSKTFWVGLGLALAIQAAILLIGDLTAKNRASAYLQGLENFTRKI